MRKIRLIDIMYWPFALFLSLFGGALLSAQNAHAFSALQSGLENLTTMHLIPLSGAVAGCATVVYVILSYFKKDEYQKYVGNILGLALFARVALGIIDVITKSFS